MAHLRRLGSAALTRTSDALVLALIAYVPFLLSSPGRVSADSKQALYVDPERFLSGAAFMWDPGSGAGTVPHQHIGYLWPMGPWFWLFDQIGVPTWIAQRLWLGTLTFLAALGARWLLRNLGFSPMVAFAGALVYALSPYQLAFTARASVLLLPWVGLPWILELTRRALRTPGWRHPALIALVVTTVAGVNASTLALVAVGPVLVLIHHGLGGLEPAARAAVTSAKVGVLGLAVSAWWLVGLRVQGSHGMPVLQLTENLSEVARWSMPNEVLRGLGNWFFAGQDRLGYSIDQAGPFLDDRRVVLASLVVPAMALAAAVLVQGARRVYAVACVLAASVVAVGAWPFDDPSLFGRVFRWFGNETSLGLAFRNSHRIVPVLVLGMAIVLAAGIASLRGRAQQRVAAGIVVVAALVAMSPVAVHGYLASNLDRPESLPDEWVALARHLEAAGGPAENPSRVLAVPGSPFAAHRWGNTVEPVLPSLIDRPHLAREVLPYGSVATTNLLDAFDRRMQEGVFEPDTLVPMARIFAAGDVVVRSDLAYERFGSPEPHALWTAITEQETVADRDITTFGSLGTNDAVEHLAPIAERDLWFPALRGEFVVRGPTPPVTAIDVHDAPRLLDLWQPDQPVVLAGDGDGVVDAVAAGLLDGRSLFVYGDSLDDAALDEAMAREAHLIVTDSNRRRIQTWFYAIRDTRGPTERAGETLYEPTGYDARLDLFPDRGDEARTVVEHVGGGMGATLSGGAARPEDRAAAAFDDDLGTAWRVGGVDPTGNRVSVALDQPVVLDHVVLVQPQDGPRDRVIDRVVIHLDGSRTVEATLGPASLEPEGERIDLGTSVSVGGIEIEIAGVTDPGFEPALANAVGFAEVRLAGVDLSETVVLPRTLLDRTGAGSDALGLDLVMTRLRSDPTARGRTDTERRLDRTFETPTSRRFALTGTARVNPGAPDPILDDLLGTAAPAVFEASSRLGGDPTARASSAFDGNPDTAWTAAFGDQEGQWIEARHTDPVEVGEVVVGLVNDELHSLPTELALIVDGETVAVHRIEALPEPGPPGSVFQVSFDPGPASGRDLRVEVVEVHRRSAPPGDPAPMSTLPVAVSGLRLGPSVAAAASGAGLDTGCRDDLATLDGAPVAVRVSGSVDGTNHNLDLESCEPDIELDAGRHRLVTVPGHESGIDIDRVVLSSAPGGGPGRLGPRGSGRPAESTLVTVESGRVSWSATVESDGEPFWLVLGQSDNHGWELSVADESTGQPVPVGDRTLVNGYANGWLVEPQAAGSFEVELRWTPQDLVWSAMAASVFAVGLCIGLVIGTSRRPALLGSGPEHVLAEPDGSVRSGWPGWPGVLVASSAAGLLTAVVSGMWIGAFAALVTAMLARWPRLVGVVAVAVPLVLVASFGLDRPELGWLCLGLVLAATLADESRSGWAGLRDRRGRRRSVVTPPRR